MYLQVSSTIFLDTGREVYYNIQLQNLLEVIVI